ncbi:hypothetical protein EMIT0158MI4_180035 [Burkholderia ambifaria]
MATTIAMIDTNHPTVTHSDSTQTRYASSRYPSSPISRRTPLHRSKNMPRTRGWMRV